MDDDEVLKQFGAMVRQRRERIGMSRDELAARAELSKQWIDRIEQGKANPSYLVLGRLARALNCQISELFGDARLGLSAEALAIAKLAQQASAPVREAIVSILLSADKVKGRK